MSLESYKTTNPLGRLSARAANCLLNKLRPLQHFTQRQRLEADERGDNISNVTLAEIAALDFNELMQFPCLGKVTMQEIRSLLNECGLDLRNVPPPSPPKKTKKPRGWQPIKTAPKDGTGILVWCFCEVGPKGHIYEAFWNDFSSDGYSDGPAWRSPEDGDEVGMATHWMPLPEPPKQAPTSTSSPL